MQPSELHAQHPDLPCIMQSRETGQDSSIVGVLYDHVQTLLALIHAVKHDFVLYAHCMFEMSSIFFSFSGHNYAHI